MQNNYMIDHNGLNTVRHKMWITAQTLRKQWSTQAKYETYLHIVVSDD